MAQIPYGPENPHPLSRLRTELVWEGKYDEYGNRRPVRLPARPFPLQRIEAIDAPRDQEKAAPGLPFNEAEFHANHHRDDWRNLLIWGDNKLVMASLLEQYRGQVDLIYIDPPFDVGADFTMQVQIGEEGDELEKEQSILEAVAYRDMWGKGTDSYLQIMYERLSLIRDLLSPQGSVFVHCDRRVNSIIRLMLDEILDTNNFMNEIIWFYKTGGMPDKLGYGRKHDTIFYYVKDPKNATWNPQQEKSYLMHKYGFSNIQILQDENGYYTYVGCRDVFDIAALRGNQPERVEYPTQKPEALLERIILGSSKEGDLIADFFCGSGTTLAVAEKLGRRWIGCDLGRYAVHTSRKRLIQVQRELFQSGKPYRSFDVYNLGRYERQWWQMDRLRGADDEHRNVVLKFYKATPLPSASSPLLHGSRAGAYVHVDQIDGIFTYPELLAAAHACGDAGGRELHCLAWEFEMELSQRKPQVEAETGVKVKLVYIPREIMEANRAEVQFFEAGALQAKAVKKGNKWDMELVSFSPALAEAPENELAALRERSVRSPFDFIDFWAVDFEWNENRPFEHHWQDFRTRRDRSLKTRTDKGWEYARGKHKIAVKVIDVFGVDTTTILDVEA